MSISDPLSPVPLDVRKVVFGAFVMPWVMRRHLGPAIAYPVLSLVLIWSVPLLLPLESIHRSMQWLASAVQVFLLAWLATQCHRVVLTNGPTEPRVTKWSGVEWKYMLWTFAVFALSGSVMMVMSMVSGTVFLNIWDHPDQTSHWWWEPLQLLAALPAAYVLGRSIFVLPAIALGGKANFNGAWQLSRGNGWRLAVVAGLLPYLHSAVGSWFYANEVAPWILPAFIPLSGCLVIVEVVAISFSYRELSRSIPLAR